MVPAPMRAIRVMGVSGSEAIVKEEEGCAVFLKLPGARGRVRGKIARLLDLGGW